ncbi:MAG: hypothetical protein JXR94_07965 [Candidatus Hydrogenedentes bacterium]|nr:hypothetical protein [Candidatus Hydrogenedentota bacterium]
MGCCLLTAALCVPRVGLVVMFLIGYAQQAFLGLLWPILGFFFMPCTTCAYAIGMVEKGELRGWSLALLIVAVVLDVGGQGGGVASRRKDWKHKSWTN